MLLFSITKYSVIPHKISEGQISYHREGRNRSLGVKFLEDLELHEQLQKARFSGENASVHAYLKFEQLQQLNCQVK